MTRFRHLQFHRLVAVALLLTGLLTQTLFACELTDDKAQAVCCCGEQVADGCEVGGGCITHDNTLTVADCCQVSVENAADITLSATISLKSQNKLDAGQPPPPALLSSVIPIKLPAYAVALIRTVPFLKTSGTNTYLVTNRLRI